MGGDGENRPKLRETHCLNHKFFFEILRCKDCNETRVCLGELQIWELGGGELKNICRISLCRISDKLYIQSRLELNWLNRLKLL